MLANCLLLDDVAEELVCEIDENADPLAPTESDISYIHRKMNLSKNGLRLESTDHDFEVLSMELTKAEDTSQESIFISDDDSVEDTAAPVVESDGESPWARCETGSTENVALKICIGNVFSLASSLEDHRTPSSALSASDNFMVVDVSQSCDPAVPIGISKLFECQQCSFSTNWPVNLRRHVFAVHKMQKSYACSICPFTSVHSRDIKEHVNARHAKVKPYKCTFCNYSTVYSRYIRSHMKAKHQLLMTSSPH